MHFSIRNLRTSRNRCPLCIPLNSFAIHDKSNFPYFFCNLLISLWYQRVQLVQRLKMGFGITVVINANWTYEKRWCTQKRYGPTTDIVKRLSFLVAYHQPIVSLCLDSLSTRGSLKAYVLLKAKLSDWSLMQSKQYNLYTVLLCIESNFLEPCSMMHFW